jgi:hypothetical protein
MITMPVKLLDHIGTPGESKNHNCIFYILGYLERYTVNGVMMQDNDRGNRRTAQQIRQCGCAGQIY